MPLNQKEHQKLVRNTWLSVEVSIEAAITTLTNSAIPGYDATYQDVGKHLGLILKSIKEELSKYPKE